MQMELDELQGQAQADAAAATEAVIIDLKAILQSSADQCNETADEKSNKGQRVLRRLVVNKDPEISLIPDFLDDAEIEHLLKLTEETWVPSVVGSGVYKTNDESKDLSNKSSQNRTSYSCSLRSGQTPIVKAIEARLGFMAGMDVDNLERLNMVRYTPGQFFNKHHDGKFRPKTIFVYLNDLPDGDGGETFFPRLGLKFTPRKGCAILWSNTAGGDTEDSRMVHQGLPPLTDVKYGVNCFFNCKPVRQWEEPDSEEEPEKVQKYRTVDTAELLRTSPVLDPLRLKAFQACVDPSILIVSNLLSPTEAADFFAFVQNEREPGQIAYVLTAIEARLAACTGLPESHLADLHTVRLEDGMLSRPQVMSDAKRPEKQPIKACFIFLNDVPNRGELRFPHLGLQVLPHTGAAVIWDITTADGKENPLAAHLGRPPKTGLRCGAVCVIHDSPVK